MRKFNNIWGTIAKEQQVWRKSMQPHQRLVIEIGAGVGMHPIQYAHHNPNDFIVAIERTTNKAQKLISRVNSHPQLNNIYPIHADAIEWISKNIDDNEVSHYFILYPNPYPKLKQANKRFMHMPFMYKLLATLQGQITLATNIESYYAEAKEVFTNTWGLDIITDEILPENYPARTHFEKKYLARQEKCFNLVLGNYMFTKK